MKEEKKSNVKTERAELIKILKLHKIEKCEIKNIIYAVEKLNLKVADVKKLILEEEEEDDEDVDFAELMEEDLGGTSSHTYNPNYDYFGMYDDDD